MPGAICAVAPGEHQGGSGLAAENYKEVVLIGIHLGCYGKEIPGGPRLSDAVKAALSVPGVPRFRLGSLESVEVEDELLKLMVENPRLCAHLHLPLQAYWL